MVPSVPIAAMRPPRHRGAADGGGRVRQIEAQAHSRRMLTSGRATP